VNPYRKALTQAYAIISQCEWSEEYTEWLRTTETLLEQDDMPKPYWKVIMSPGQKWSETFCTEEQVPDYIAAAVKQLYKAGVCGIVTVKDDKGVIQNLVEVRKIKPTAFVQA
jgi:hypothetical protein